MTIYHYIPFCELTCAVDSSLSYSSNYPDISLSTPMYEDNTLLQCARFQTATGGREWHRTNTTTYMQRPALKLFDFIISIMKQYKFKRQRFTSYDCILHMDQLSRNFNLSRCIFRIQ